MKKIYEKLIQQDFPFASKYSILIPLVEVDHEVHLLFEVRASHLRRNPGQICFPGGRIEKEDRNPKYTAIRETSEELGIGEEKIVDIQPFDMIASPQNHIVYLFFGQIKDANMVRPNRDEVAEVFTVPLNVLRKMKPEQSKVTYRAEPDEGFPLDLIGGEDFKWSARHTDHYFYQYEGKVIWGLTARILTYFLNVLED